MNGPDHYREAKQDVDRANARPMGGEAEYMLARAQVHATLALTAAVIGLRSAYVASHGGVSGALTYAWEQAIGNQ